MRDADITVAAGSSYGLVGPAGLLVALALVVAGLVVGWAHLLGPHRLERPVVRGSGAGGPALAGWAGLAGHGTALGAWAARSAVGAVYVKEMRTWWRDPERVQGLVVAPVFAVLTCLVPVPFGSTALLPFTGAVTALMDAMTCGNLYGQHGTALWLTLLSPGTEGADVRGRRSPG